jgi:hypothetical protein
VRSFYIAFVLAQLLVACGGKTASDGDGTVVGSGTGGNTAINTDSSLGGVSGTSGGNAATVGGTSAIATGGAPTTGGCASTPVTFQVTQTANNATNWCIGQPASCGNWATIGNSSGDLQLETNCTVDCDTCDRKLCHPTLCRPPIELTGQNFTDSWDGTYITASTCGASAESCAQTNCASPGQYTYTACGFPSPTPGWTGGCGEAPSSTPQTCITVYFEYPASAPVVITMPAE